MTYNRYYLNCRIKVGCSEHDSTVWIFHSKKACENVLEIMKKDDGHLGKFLYIEEYTKE